jgi:hypothetical protein
MKTPRGHGVLLVNLLLFNKLRAGSHVDQNQITKTPHFDKLSAGCNTEIFL